MKKYVSCFLFFLVLTAGCLVSLFVLTIDPPRQRAAEVQMTESVEQPAWQKAAERRRWPTWC